MSTSSDLKKIAICVLSRSNWLAWRKFAGPVAGSSYSDYEQLVRAFVADAVAQGYEVVEVPFDPDDFSAFCRDNNLSISTPDEVIQARAAWAGFRIKLLHCLRCDYDWWPRKIGEKPKFCPRCNSPYWDKPRRK